MADSPITGLPELFITSLTDVLVIDDLDTSITKKIEIQNLMLYPGPIGAGAANTGEFTTLQLPSGATINEFSIDGTLGGNSDLALPTEKAVKTYVDAQIATTDEHNELLGLQGGDSTSEQYYHLTLSQHNGLTDGGITFLHTHSVGSFPHNSLGSLQGGDSTASEFYHLTQTIHDQLFSASPLIGLGDPASTNIKVFNDPGGFTPYITMTLDGAFYSGPVLDAKVDRMEMGDISTASMTISWLNDNIVFTSTAIQRLGINQFGITLQNGGPIDEFSIDGTLAGNSDAAVPTEKAVKTYVDAQIATTDEHNELIGLQGGDSTADEFYHLTQSIHDGLFSASPTIGLGDPNGTRLEVDYGADLVSINVGTVQIFDADDEEIIFGITSGIRLRIDYADDEVFKFYDNTGTERLRVSEDGIRLNSGTSFVNEFSIDGTLAGNSDTAIPTEKAVKTYVDNVQALDTINGSWEVVNEDSTASVIFDTPQVDTLYSVVGNLVNEVDGVPSIYAHIITEKSTAGFVVLFSGPMDSANYEFDWILSRMGLASSSSSSSALPLLAINDGDDILEINDGGDGLLLS